MGQESPGNTTMKNTSINLKEKTHIDLKVFCAKNQISMGDMIEAAVIEKMERDK